MALSRRQWRLISRFIETAQCLHLRDWDADFITDLAERFPREGVDTRITNADWETIGRIQEQHCLG